MTSPIIETNIERILEDNLWEEVGLIDTRIANLMLEVNNLNLRKEKLERIAEAADIPNPKHTER
jgi:hypothetical protein